MLGRERGPVDHEVEALIAQRGRNGWRVANVGMDRTHVTRGVAPSAVEQREVDAALGEQLRDASEMLPVPPIERTRMSMT